MKRSSFLISLLALALVVTACSSDEPEATTTTVPETTTTVAETTTTTPVTTTTVAAGPASLLNGLPVADGAPQDRRVVAVKIDNHPDARPQSGVQDAEAVIELLVEAGLTRFIALYHATDSEYVGPVRSVRPTDPGLIKPLGSTFQFSGGQPWIQSLVAANEVPFLTENAPSTWRIPRNGRAYERTLFSSSLLIRDEADAREFPDDPPSGPWLPFGEPTAEGAPASEVALSWSRNWPDVIWTWDGSQYLRSNADMPHGWVDDEGNGEQIAADTLVVIMAEKYNACPSGGQGGSCVPAEVTTGEGDVAIFSGGQVFEGTWERETSDDFFSFTAADGTDLPVPPGYLWMSVFPNDRTVTWE